MTSRIDIMPSERGWRRLSYTCRAGWVDWGHASAENAAELKRNLIAEKSFPETLCGTAYKWKLTPAWAEYLPLFFNIRKE